MTGPGATPTPVKTVFLGSGTFAVPIVSALVEHPRVRLDAVVTAAPRPAGRGCRVQPSPVARWAAEAEVPTLTPNRLRDPDAIASIERLAPQLLVLADYGQIVPSALLALPEHGALNLHPSLLPRHRGASPVAAAIAAGDRRTGITLMLMDEGLDTGPIIAQRHRSLDGHGTTGELEHELAALGAQLLTDTLDDWLDGVRDARPQASSDGTITRRLRRRDGWLDPRVDAATLERLVRALQPWPGTYLETPVGHLIVWAAAARPSPAESSEGPGRLIQTGEGLSLTTGEGRLELLDLQLAGRRRMTGAELLRGRPSLADAFVTAPEMAIQPFWQPLDPTESAHPDRAAPRRVGPSQPTDPGQPR